MTTHELTLQVKIPDQSLGTFLEWLGEFEVTHRDSVFGLMSANTEAISIMKDRGVLDGHEPSFALRLRPSAEVAEQLVREAERREWLAVRKAEALKVDPETAEVFLGYIEMPHPYDVTPDLLDNCKHLVRGPFARRPESDIWVSFDDLPDATKDRLLQKINERQLYDEISFL